MNTRTTQSGKTAIVERARSMPARPPRGHREASRPEFIGIGAARAGTTWLAKNLTRCPDVWIPPRKELHYFTRGQGYHSPSYLADRSFVRRLLGTRKHHRQFRAKLLRALGKDLMRRSLSELAWDLRYFLGEPDDEWYRTLFTSRPEPITGEITPAYSLLDDADVERIADAFPGTRFIFIVRNPVDRDWSTLLYHERRYGRGIVDRPESEILAYLSQPGIVERSDYAGTCARWRRHVGDERFCLLFFDEIMTSPQKALERVFRFLGVADREHRIENALYDPINASRPEPIPASLEGWLSRRYLAGLEAFARMTGGPALDWLARARGAMDRPPVHATARPIAFSLQPVGEAS